MVFSGILSYKSYHSVYYENETVVYYNYTYENEPFKLGLRFNFMITEDKTPMLGVLGILLMSYVYSATFPETIVVDALPLNEEDCRFWGEYYKGCFGELFFLINHPFPTDNIFQPNKILKQTKNILYEDRNFTVTLGLGKDSFVSYELLEGDKTWFYYTCAYSGVDDFNTNWRVRRTSEITNTHIDRVIEDFETTSWKRLEELSYTRVCPKGTVLDSSFPFHFYDYICMLGLVICSAFISGFERGSNSVVVGLESSTEEVNTIHQGRSINHQYEKTKEAVLSLENYLRRNVDPNLQIISPIFHLRDLDIAQWMVEKFPKYIPIFISCNEGVNERQTQWCGKCPKCVFTCLIFSAWLEPQRVWSIFGDDILENPENIKCIHRLLFSKPYECVGTYSEVKEAIQLVKEQYKKTHLSLPVCLSVHYSQN